MAAAESASTSPHVEDSGALGDPEASPQSGEQNAAAGGPQTVHGPQGGGFSFGSYGRVMVAGDGTGRPGRNADIVAFGSRLDHDNYVELELRRDDHWAATGADTRLVATLALGNPVFHYNGEFDAQLAVRNLYLEERGLGLKGLSFWAGSRMLRGDDIYLLDFWPLDNLNTLGAGLRYEAPTDTTVQLHVGASQPNNAFYKQQSERANPFNQFGAATIDVLDRERWVGSLRAEQRFFFGGGAGMKVVAYGEVHQLPAGQRETSQIGVFDDLPHDGGMVLGAQFGAFTGKRDTHVNVFVRYASGIAAYGPFAHPAGLASDRSADGAHELLAAAGGNWELGPVAVLLGAYVRSFRNASEGLDFGDVDEGIVIARPHVFFNDWAGLAAEASYQVQQRGVLAKSSEATAGLADDAAEPLVARVTRLGVIPFVSPAGRGAFKRPVFWLVYAASFRDEGARALYPVDDVFNSRDIDHFIGVGAEWWFGSTSYGEAP